MTISNLVDPLLHAGACLLGAAIVVVTMASAVSTIILPRSATDAVTRSVFRNLRHVFDALASRARSYEERDRAMAYYAPVGLLALLGTWLALIWTGYAIAYWAMGAADAWDALKLSGSSLVTLGIATSPDMLTTLAIFSEATIGLVLVAVLIAYLPTMYAGFSRRESAVSLLEVRAGSPPSAPEMIARYHRIHGLDALNAVWVSWEVWFVDVEETHTSLAALPFFRSPQPDHSWVTAAGALLDAASLVNAVVDTPHDPQADLCIRAGYLALRRIADSFRLPYNSAPAADDPISVSQAEFDAACEQMAAAGVALKADRAAAWRAFRGWRVNYDDVLLRLAALTMAPYAPWSSDRSQWNPPRPAGRK